jgi:hypothetical protein
MDGAGTTIFDRIEQKLSAHGVSVDISDLKQTVSQYDARIAGNPADLDSKMIGLELRVVMLARLLNAAVDALDGRAAAPAAAEATAEAAPAATTATAAAPVKKVRRLRQNPATGVIEEVEDAAEDNVIVADSRGRFGGKGGGDPKREAKKTVFIAAVDDEPVTPAKKK